MSNVSNKIAFPRSSPDKLIEMAEILVSQHDKNPKKVSTTPEKIEFIRSNVALAKQKREEAKAAMQLSVKLNSEADRVLGVAIGQSLDSETHVAGAVSDFSKRAQLDLKDDLTQLRDYGFTVTQSIKAQRISKERMNKLQKKD